MSNKFNSKKSAIVVIVIAAILLADQALKIWVKTHMQIGEEIPMIGTWFKLHFIENVGFAFGINFGENAGKVALTLFRIVASAAIVWYMCRIIKKGTRTTLVISLTLIVAGAIGNLIDSCFYGLIFNESYYSVATLFPPEGGYASLFHGRVVDMFYFPLFSFVWPQWMPFWGGQEFEFFNAIFNIADASITIGVVLLLIDQLWLKDDEKEETEEKSAA